MRMMGISIFVLEPEPMEVQESASTEESVKKETDEMEQDSEGKPQGDQDDRRDKVS